MRRYLKIGIAVVVCLTGGIGWLVGRPAVSPRDQQRLDYIRNLEDDWRRANPADKSVIWDHINQIALSLDHVPDELSRWLKENR